jgi:hypothetical protein
MSFTDDWPQDWHIADGDEAFSRKLVPIFESYLEALQQKGVAKSTFNRHLNSCHALGGYIVDQVYNYEWDHFDPEATGREILLHYLDGYEGPLVFQDNESWQREVDTTARKLYKFLNGKPV